MTFDTVGHSVEDRTRRYRRPAELRIKPLPPGHRPEPPTTPSRPRSTRSPARPPAGPARPACAWGTRPGSALRAPPRKPPPWCRRTPDTRPRATAGRDRAPNARFTASRQPAKQQEVPPPCRPSAPPSRGRRTPRPLRRSPGRSPTPETRRDPSRSRPTVVSMRSPRTASPFDPICTGSRVGHDPLYAVDPRGVHATGSPASAGRSPSLQSIRAIAVCFFI